MIDTLGPFDSDVRIRGQLILNLRFANDIDLICSNEDLRLLDISSRSYGMEINAE